MSGNSTPHLSLVASKLHDCKFNMHIYYCSVRIEMSTACLLERRLDIGGPHELDAEKSELGVGAVHKAAEPRDVRPDVGDFRRADSRQVLHRELQKTTIKSNGYFASSHRLVFRRAGMPVSGNGRH